MTRPGPLSVLRLRFVPLLSVAAATALLTACASPPAYTAPTAAPGTTGSAWDEHTTRPTRTPTPIPTPTATPTPTPEPPHDLAWYRGQLPQFDPAPTPQPVWLSRYEGQAALAYQIPTDQPVAFLTIDDGIVRHPMALELIKAAKIPVTLFLTTNYVVNNQSWFSALRGTGYVTIENHTVSHPNLRTNGYSVARDELCGASDNLAAWFGQRPTYFRPPFGEYDGATLQAAWDCGLQVGFHWRETVDQGIVNYQRDAGRIHAGDIILMHFRDAFPDDFLAALQAIKNSGLAPALLEDYVRVGDGTPLPPPPPPTTTDPPPTTEPPPTTTDPPPTTDPPTSA